MAENDSKAEPRTLVAVELERHSRDMQELLHMLGKMGLNPEVINNYDELRLHEVLDARRIPIDSITSPEQYLGREHFVSYRDTYGTDFNVSVATRAFDKSTSSSITDGLIRLDIASRDSVGLGNIPKDYWPSADSTSNRGSGARAGLAIKASSVVDLAGFLNAEHRFLPYGVGIQTALFMRNLADFLESRFVTEEQS